MSSKLLNVHMQTKHRALDAYICNVFLYMLYSFFFSDNLNTDKMNFLLLRNLYPFFFLFYLLVLFSWIILALFSPDFIRFMFWLIDFIDKFFYQVGLIWHRLVSYRSSLWIVDIWITIARDPSLLTMGISGLFRNKSALLLLPRQLSAFWRGSGGVPTLVGLKFDLKDKITVQ